ncbi:nicotinate-nucleotide--dimethylbenzimidazole phosphoribosyltransferase [Thermosipho melanesiensis]|nr:nicotinate-nucleotide--dimethylbenzimidazole phosphoribosyltransferase [Thermosipho melanesiensis]
MRLGEGTGAVLAISIIEAAVKLYRFWGDKYDCINYGWR